MNSKKTRKLYKIHIKLIVFLSVMIYIVIPLAPFIESPIGIFSKENASLFLSYYGTIIGGITGGALTLGGVWWTIKKQDEQKYNDNISLNKPILVPEIIIYDKESTDGKTKIQLNVLLKNIGQTEASNIKCDNRLYKVKLSSGDGPDPSVILPNTYSKTENTITYIDNPQEMDFDIELEYSHGINKNIIYHSRYKVYFYNKNIDKNDKNSLDYFIALESYEVNQS